MEKVSKGRLIFIFQEAFDNVSDKFYERLSKEQRDALDKALKHTNVEVLLSALFECIILRITVKTGPGEDDVDYSDIK